MRRLTSSMTWRSCGETRMAVTIAPKPASASTTSGQTPTRRLTSRDTPFASTRMSPTFRRVTKVDAMPERSRSRNSIRFRCVPTATISSAPFSNASSSARSSLIPGAGTVWYGDAEPVEPRSARRVAVAAVRVDDDLGTAEQRLVRDRVHVSDDDVRLPAELEQRVGAAVHGDEHGLEVADVALDDPQVALHPGTARDDERVPVAEARAQRRELHRAGEHAALLAQVAHRVLGELLERMRHAPALIGERARQLVDAQRASRRDAVAVPEDAAAAHRYELALAHRVEQLRAGDVDQLHAAAHEQQRPRVREAAGLRRRAVDDDARARVEQLLRRDAVDVAVVDDRDVAALQPPRRGASSSGRGAPAL